MTDTGNFIHGLSQSRSFRLASPPARRLVWTCTNVLWRSEYIRVYHESASRAINGEAELMQGGESQPDKWTTSARAS